MFVRGPLKNGVVFDAVFGGWFFLILEIWPHFDRTSAAGALGEGRKTGLHVKDVHVQWNQLVYSMSHLWLVGPSASLTYPT